MGSLAKVRLALDIAVPVVFIAMTVWAFLPSTQEKVARAIARAAWEEEARHQERRLFGGELA